MTVNDQQIVDRALIRMDSEFDQMFAEFCDEQDLGDIREDVKVVALHWFKLGGRWGFKEGAEATSQVVKDSIRKLSGGQP